MATGNFAEPGRRPNNFPNDAKSDFATKLPTLFFNPVSVCFVMQRHWREGEWERALREAEGD